MSFNPPVLWDPDQPENFDDILTEVEIQLMRAGLTWQSDRVRDYVFRLHAAKGFYPATWQAAYYGLSFLQLQTILKKLKELPNASTDPNPLEGIAQEGLPASGTSV